MLPRFLIGDNYEHQDRVYVIHTIKPKFIVQCNVEDFNVDQKVYWFDKEPNTEEVEKLMDEAEAYYLKEFEELDKLIDEEDEYEEDDEE